MSIRRSQGFTLIEAMVVLVIVGAVAAISLDMLTGAAKAEARRQMVSQQATEMATLNRAVTEWVRTATGLPTNTGDILEVDLQRVIDAGALPSEFARRPASGSTAPISPLGQHYRAFIRRTAGRTYEIAVMPLGTPRPGFAARAGVSNEPESLRVFNIGVMQEIRSRFTLPAGVINQGTASIDSAASGFTLDLSAFLGGNAADMTIAALSNFAELAMFTEAAPSNQAQSFVGRTCRATISPCTAGEEEASRYAACRAWGLHRQSGLPHQTVGEVFVTPIGNIQITKFTNITDINSVSQQGGGQINGMPPATTFNTGRAGPVSIAGTRAIRDWEGNFISFAIDCRHPDGTVWQCGTSPDRSTDMDYNISPMPSQIVSGSLSQFGPFVSESVASREIIWSLNTPVTSNWRRIGERPSCSGSVQTVASPRWIQDLHLRQGFPGFTGSTDGFFMGPNGSFQIESIGATPVYPSRFDQGGVGPATRLTYFETKQIPGQSPITTVCEENILSNAASVANPRPTGWAGATLGSGSNACPITSMVARFGSTNFTLGSGRAFETFQFRPADTDQPIIRVCCR